MKQLLRFLRYYRPHRGLFVLDLLAALAQSGFSVLIPMVVYRVFDRVLPSGDWGALWPQLGLLLMLAVLAAAADFVSVRWGHVLGVRMETDMRSDLFRHLQRLSFGYFDRTRTGHLMSRITNDLNQISEVAHHGPEDLLISVFTLSGAFVMMFVLNWKLALIAMIPLPFVVLWAAVFRRRMHDGFQRVRREIAEINSRVENSIQGIREVKSFTGERREMHRFLLVNREFRLARENVCGALANFHTGIGFLMQCYSLLFIGAGAVLVFRSEATVPQILAFYMYARYINMPIFRLTAFIEQFFNGITAFERFTEVMDESPEIRDVPGAVELCRPRGDVVLRDVGFHYPRYTSAASGPGDAPPPAADPAWQLEHIDITVPAGKMIALVGESGAGKSTIAALIPRFYEIDSGSLTIDGIEVRRIMQRSLRENIGIVRQDAFLFDSSIGDNIRFGRPDVPPDRVEAAARAAGIFDFIDALPDKFDTPVGEHGVRLSGGQRQRLAIARVFLKDPPILIFDEATSSLDNRSEADVQEALNALCQGRTTIVIAHRLSTVRNADLIYCLRHGRVVEAGTFDELMARKGYYYELHSLHAR